MRPSTASTSSPGSSGVSPKVRATGTDSPQRVPVGAGEEDMLVPSEGPTSRPTTSQAAGTIQATAITSNRLVRDMDASCTALQTGGRGTRGA